MNRDDVEKSGVDAWAKYFFGNDRPPSSATFPAQGLVRIFRGSYPLLPKVPESGLAVDVGCGDGRNSRFLSNQGFQVIGIETESSHVIQLRKAFPSGNFLEGSCAKIPLPSESADATVAWNSCYYMNDSAVTLSDHLSELYRITRPGGVIVVSMPMPTSFIFNGAVRESPKEDSAQGVKYLVIEQDPFDLRNGSILATYETVSHLRTNVESLGNLRLVVASEEGDWFGLRYDWWVWFAVKETH